MKSTRIVQSRKPLWGSIGALLGLWVALAILPDALSTLFLKVKAEPVFNSHFEVQPVGQVVNCLDSHSAAMLQQCALHHPKQTNGTIWVLLPVRWADIEEEKGVLNWANLDHALMAVKSYGGEPILTLHTVPAWLTSREPQWDRDSPLAISSFPSEFALFSRQVAEKFGDRVQIYQLGIFANNAIPGFAYGTNPVRYGQMAKSAIPYILAADPDATFLTAPLQPETTATQTAFPPGKWLSRLAATGAAGVFDMLLWLPGAAGKGRNPNYDWMVRLQSQRNADPLDIWSWTATGDPFVWQVLTFSQKDYVQKEVFSLSRLPSNFAASWSWQIYLPFLLVPLLLAAGWRRSVPPLTEFFRAGLVHKSRVWKNTVWLIAAPALLTLIFLAPSWTWAIAPLIVLSGLALGKPAMLFLLILTFLPLQQLHANFTSPLQTQGFSLSPAHVLTMALTPVVLYRPRPLSLVYNRGSFAWLIGGWFLLLLLAGLGIAGAGNIGQWVHIGLYPGWLALLAIGTGLNRDNVKNYIVSLTTGISLFGLLALAQWSIQQWEEKVNLIRLSGLTFSPNHAAMLLERGVWMALSLALIARGRERSGWLVLTTLIGGSLLLTLSRGALTLGLAGGILAFWLSLRKTPVLKPHKATKTGILAAGTIAVAFGIGVAVARADLWARLLDASPAAARLEIWSHTWDLVKSNLWLGLGVEGLYHQAAAAFPYSAIVSPDIAHAHNVWLEILTRWGAAGLIWLAGLAICLVRGHKAGPLPTGQSPLLMAGAAGALSAGLAHAQVDAFWHWGDIAAMNLILVLSLFAILSPVSGDAKQEAGTIQRKRRRAFAFGVSSSI